MKLFDETHEYGEADSRRTIWHQFGETDDFVNFIFSEPNPEYGSRTVVAADYAPLAKALKKLIEADLLPSPENVTSETHWVFYTGVLDGDAIDDKVRFTIYVRLKGSRYDCNINMSDFIFASSFDNVQKIKASLEEYLNRE